MATETGRTPFELARMAWLAGLAGAISLAMLAVPPVQAASPQLSNPSRVVIPDPWLRQRTQMVEHQIVARGVSDPRVLTAMREVPRHLFVPETFRPESYDDHPLPIGEGQTISQPYIVATMTEQLDLKPGDRVLEIGTGSGYQAAVLSRMVRRVFSIEIVEKLAKRARRTLTRLGIGNVEVRTGDGYRGWPEKAPFDAILLTAAPPEVPAPLVEQLKVGGRMVLPVGSGPHQELVVLTKTATGVERRRVAAVRFVPMTGEAENPPPR